MRGLRSRVRSLWRGLRAPSQLDAEMDEEMRFHLDMEAERLVREEGLAPQEARRRAAVAFGGVERHKEEGRDVRGLTAVTGLALDLRLGVRMLRKYPGLTVVAVLALSVAIGGGAMYLEVVRDLTRPTLALEGGERLVGVVTWDAARGRARERALHDFAVWRQEARTLDALGAFRAVERTLVTDDGRAEPVRGVEISPSAFRIVRVPPLLGRPLLEEDARPGAPPVVVLGHEVWQARFGGDAGVVGRTVRLGSAAYQVVGVMPPGFAFPVHHGLWAPLTLDGAAFRRGEGPAIKVFGRLAPGVGLDEAEAELAALARRTAADAPEDALQLRPRVTPYVESIWLSVEDGELQVRIMYALNLFFLALLGVCGANVATLVFARTATREAELTVRTALGANRGRLVMQLFAEALVLTSVSAGVGLGAAAFGLGWLKAKLVETVGSRLPFWWDDRLSLETVLYAGGLAVLAALVVGVVPALRATGPRLQARLNLGSSSAPGMKFGGLWTGVIVAQVGLTVLFLLVVASVGWNTHVGRYGAPRIELPATEYLTTRVELERDAAPGVSPEEADAAFRARLQASYEELARRLAAEPGVAGVTFASRLPGVDPPGEAIEVEGLEGAEHELWTRHTSVDVGFFDALGVSALSGRTFLPADVATGRAVALVDQTFVQKVLGGREAVGRRLRVLSQERDGKPGPWLEIVGTVRDLTGSTHKPAGEAMVYQPAAPGSVHPLHVAVRARADALALAPRLRSVAAAVDPGLQLHAVKRLDEVQMGPKVALEVFTVVLAAVGGIALMLSTAGVYALMWFTVARRTREIGIRAALGAAPGRIVAGIFSRAFAQLAVGVAAGALPGALLVAQGAPEVAQGAGLQVALAACAGAAVFMLVVGLAAGWLPMRRALRIQPTEALRAE